ncbi:hypothetical protein SLS62_010119 [Diatrype stigma]|uniref:Uncharacterized protein n=1 Tax=Diatrype stigma TaxID=117547 RepID=A0AAN9UE64_9PEZI
MGLDFEGLAISDRKIIVAIDFGTTDLEPSLQPSSSSQRSTNRYDALELVAEYLSKLGEHFLYTLRQKLGGAFVSKVPLEFILTVPAIWSDLAKSKTLIACQRAGHPFQGRKITLVSEPEAAAIYTLHGLDPHDLQVGDSFVICDAGGGTVDLISYTITTLQPILEIKEASVGSGALCGSTYLNQRFEMFLRSRLKNEDGFDDELVAEAMERFEDQVSSEAPISLLRYYAE